MYCWGHNDRAQLGENSFFDRLFPSPIFSIDQDWKQVDLGLDHSFGLRNGKLFGWGNNSLGQLGDGTVIDRTKPTQVIAP